MTRIITYAYRPKRAPRKKPKAAAMEIPALVSVPTKRDRIRRREEAASRSRPGRRQRPLRSSPV